jgi:hypothetical protein
MTGGPPDDDPDLIDRLEAGEPPRSPEEAQARAPYEQLFERIHGLRDIAPPAGWEDRAVARWSAARRRRRIGEIAGGTAVAAVTAVILLQLCGRSSAPGLELATLDASGAVRRGDTAVGDVLRARARLDQAHLELRVYLGADLVARCPGNATCRLDGSVMELDWKLTAPGSYLIVTISSADAIPGGDRTLDRDLLDAQSAGANIERRSLRVSP